MTDTQHRALGLAIAEGRAYTTQDVPKDLWRMVFMPLMWASPEQLKDVRMAVAVVGEDTTSGQAVNGYPLFFSCRTLNLRDTKRVVAYARRFGKARRKMLNKEEP